MRVHTGDESCRRLAEVARNLLERTCDVVSVKTSRTGFTESTTILGLYEGLGGGVVGGNHIDGTIPTVASVTLAAANLTPPEAPGLGVEIDDEKLERYRTDR